MPWARAVEFETGHGGRTRSGGDDDAVESQAFFATGGLCNFHRGGIHECGFTLYELDLALFRELSKSAGQLVDDSFFPSAELVEIDFGLSEFYAPVLRLLGFFEQLGHVQQSLGRDAAAIEADAARGYFRIDQRNFHAQVGSQKRGGVSAGTATDYSQMES